MIMEKISEESVVKRIGSYIIAKNEDSKMWPYILYKGVNYCYKPGEEVEYLGQFADMNSVERYISPYQKKDRN
jgi:hypothetical protein